MAGGGKLVVVVLFSVPTPAATSADANATIDQLFISFVRYNAFWLFGWLVILYFCCLVWEDLEYSLTFT